jgi:hypothetical protein
LARGQTVQIVFRHGIRGGPKGVLVAMRTFVFVHGGALPAFVAVSVEGMSLIHRVVDLRDRPEFRVTRGFLRSHDDYVGVKVRHVERFLTGADNAVFRHVSDLLIAGVKGFQAEH